MSLCNIPLSKRPGSVWNCLWGNALKRSGIIRKSRVSYPVSGFLSSATWPLLPNKHYNGLKPKPNQNNASFNLLRPNLHHSATCMANFVVTSFTFFPTICQRLFSSIFFDFQMTCFINCSSTV